jgi:hypothetical protein
MFPVSANASGVGSGISGVRSVEPRPVGTLESRLGYIVDSLGSAHERVSVLEKRLQPVLRPAPPQGETGVANGRSPAPAESPLSEQAAHAARGLDALILRLEMLAAQVDA